MPMARLHTAWNQQRKARSCRQVGSALAVNIWKLSAECLLNLENEGFETVSSQQRLDVVCEFSAYLLHLLDRLVYRRLSDNERAELIAETARKIAELIDGNRAELGASAEQHEQTAAVINARGSDYAECSFELETGPSFTLMRLLGEAVRSAMGAKDNKWIPDYVIDSEAPRAYASLKKAAEKMLALSEASSARGGHRS